ncbi:hypothetical protein QTT33_004370 [Salmonella enterica]|nr:hypothetical protein [Salmonella enterica]
MMIFTFNEYMKKGIEEICKQSDFDIDTKILIFEYDRTIIFLEQPALCLNPEKSLCDALASGFHFKPKSGDALEKFRIFLNLWGNRDSLNFQKKLTFSEETVIRELLLGYSIKTLSITYGKNINTLSVHKASALKKMGVRNLQTLHLMVLSWKRHLNISQRRENIEPLISSPTI